MRGPRYSKILRRRAERSLAVAVYNALSIAAELQAARCE